MSIFNIDGEALSSAYDVNGNVLSSIYDVDGNVLQDDYVPVDINDIPSYWHEELAYTLDYVDGFNSDYVHYLVITDSHITSRKTVNRSADIANYLMENGNFSKLLLLGDNANEGTEDDADYALLLGFGFNKQNKRGRILALRGNHDDGVNSEVFYNDFMSNSRVSHDSSYNYWTFDDSEHKIRILGMSPNSSPNTDYLQKTITTMPTGYSLLVLNHYNFSEPNPEWVMNLSTNSSKNIISMLREANIPLIGYWCGHQHLDELSLLDGNIYHNMFMCDQFDTTDWYDYYTYPPRLRDTFDSMTGQTLTVASVNTKTKDVRFYRIGNCHNDQYKRWSYTYGNTIPDPTLNVLDITTGLIYDVYITRDGVQLGYDGWSATDFIDVSQYSEIQLYTDSGLVGGFVQNYCQWYDSNQSPVDTLRFGATLLADTTSNYIAVPNGVKYFRLSDVTENIASHIYVRARIKS